MVISTASSSLSTEAFWRSRMLPFPRSPETANLTPSLEHPIEHVSPSTDMSRTILWNSPADIFTVVEYSCSGMPRCSESMSINLSSNSETRSWDSLSKTIVSTSPSSCAFKVTESSLPAHLRIFARLGKLIPRETVRSQRKWANMSEGRLKETRATWELSMAWRWIPASFTSKMPSETRSLMASTIFLKSTPLTSVASNMARFGVGDGGRGGCGWAEGLLGDSSTRRAF
mmetsp:Transcript_833/g.2949  ORF Transcript_833/g.2949 Transcript_833/m.2949 type:complete len:229 (-) Transcript_833:7-693(-)